MKHYQKLLLSFYAAILLAITAVSPFLFPANISAAETSVLTPYVLTDGSEQDLAKEKTFRFSSDGKELIRLDIPKDGALSVNLYAEKADFIIADLYTSEDASGLPTYLKASCTTANRKRGTMFHYFQKGTYYLRFPENTYEAGLQLYPVRKITLKDGMSSAAYCDYSHENVYTFKAPKDGCIIATELSLDDSPATISSVLCNSKGKAMTERGLFTQNRGCQVAYAVKKGTAYQLKIKPLNSGETKCYRLTLKFKAVSEKSGTSKKKAVSVKLGNRVSGTVFAEDSVSKADWYKLKSEKKQELVLDFSGYITSGSMIFDVYDTRGNKLDSYSVLSNIGDPHENTLHNGKGSTQMPAGTYYLKVTKAGKTTSGMYSFSISGK